MWYCGGQSGIPKGCSVPCKYHSISAPYSFVNLSQMLYIVGIGQCNYVTHKAWRCIFQWGIVSCIYYNEKFQYLDGQPQVEQVSAVRWHYRIWLVLNSVSTALYKVRRAVCGRSLAGIVGSNPAGGTDVCHECCVLSGRDLSIRLSTCPKESYWVYCVQWVWLRSPVRGWSAMGGREEARWKKKYL